ncbi:angiotensin-converting enzyme [Holotrichia oblita]|uniref:Angiotensin-converting enzyme n=1 Tax=Holotrichia oblita TaxID=644536 RepID=A0ACB9SSX4_HOLOL|nr:angiotensin-converting enzyme [Holotrichia oblita]
MDLLHRETIQKVKSPVARTEDDFDPGAKFHVAADYQYISYFVAHILEFQFFKALCIAAGEYGEGSDKALHECDYYNSAEAGDLLRAGLSLGASRHWEDVLEIMTGSREMSADALLEYFNPLYEFLHDANDQEITQEELEDYFYVDYQFAAVRELGAARKVDWQFDLNMGTTNVAKLESVLETAVFRRYWRTFFEGIEYTQPDILQQLEEVNNLGDAALSNDTLSELTDYLIDWKLRYSGIRVCPFQNSNCVVQQQGLDEEEIQRNMASSENLAEMLYYWTYWRDFSGLLVNKDNYGRYISLANEAAAANSMYRSLWGESWWGLTEVMRPYPNNDNINFNAILSDISIPDIAELVDTFFKSMELEGTAAGADALNYFSKPSAESVCEPTAIDIYGQYHRVKICSTNTRANFKTVHNMLSHVQSFMLYKDQPVVFRNAPTPALYDAVGGAIALSAITPQHLRALELIEEFDESENSDLNLLMDTALETLPLLPFALVVDNWRWDVFDSLQQSSWNSRKEFQKVKAPVTIAESDFDAISKYHVLADEQYINKFVSTILQFQIYKELCIKAEKYNPTTKNPPLHRCSFFGSSAAGAVLKDALSRGSSEDWVEILKTLTGETEVNASAMLEYFEPLHEYFVEISGGMTSSGLKSFLEGEYAEKAQEVYNAQVQAGWNYATNVNEETAQQQIEATLATAIFDKENWENVFGKLRENNFVAEVLQRQVKFLRVLGDAALDEENLSELKSAVSSMSSIYNTAKVCPYVKQQCDLDTEGLALNPGIEERISASEDVDELLYFWTAWRSASGANMKEHFDTYVRLSNEAAVANGFTDKGEMWRNRFESSTFIEDLDRLWKKVEPLYNELHTYVRRKLRAKYGSALDLSYDLIPAHVLGNMWAQSWVNIASLVKPYPEVSSADITAAMIEKGYDVEKMFEVADEFYTSLGLESCAMSFGNGSMIVRPEGKEVNCHASAWDFRDGETFR